jgi:hypothetical protein
MWSRRRALLLALVTAAGGPGAALLAGCSTRPPHGEPLPADALPRESNPWPRPEQTAELFRPGSRHLLETGEWVTAATLSGGVLRLPTGRLVAADPSWLDTWESSGIAPYTATVPPGQYPVTLALVELPGHKRVAAAKVAIRAEPVATWDMALRPGEDPGTLAANEAFLVGVDVATIALFDAVALAAMAVRTEADPTYYERIAADRPSELDDPASGANLIAFETGWGDGGYPVWIGRTATGAVGCFIVDMAMLARPAAPSESPSG